jgi:hypothetical protein
MDWKRTHRVLTLAFALLAISIPASAAGVHVRLEPPNVVVNPGDEFTVEVVITEAGDQFNAFEAKITYSTAHLQYVSGTNQIGPLLTSACPDHFHRFIPGSGEVNIDESMLCSETFVTGPGVVYRLRFKALNMKGPSALTIDSHFYKAGFFTPLAEQHGMQACIQNCTTDVGDGQFLGTRLTLEQPRPNPRAGVIPSTFVFSLPRADRVSLELLDANGRIMAQRAAADFTAGRHTVVWRVPNLPSGMYFARIKTASGLSAKRSWVVLK